MSVNTYNQILTKGPESALPVVEDGKLRFTIDTGRLFVDGSNNARTEITDFVKGLTESEIKSQLSPLASKIYIASDTGKLFIYNATTDNWETVSRDAETVNGKTVGANVPADAVFTDTKDAAHIDYNNSISGLTATKVQGAIDEVVSVKQNAFERISYADWQLLTPQQQAAKPYYIYDYPASASVQVQAEDVDYDNTTSGLTATEIQDAIDELNVKVDNKVNVSDMYNLLYPIGSVYISITNTNPSTMFGGTWELMGNGYLRNNAPSISGGSLTSGSTTLTADQIPAHSHTATSSSAGGHTHTSTTQSTGGHTHTSTTGSYGSHTHTATTQNTGAHTHTLTSNSAGGHTHTATTNTTGEHTHNTNEKMLCGYTTDAQLAYNWGSNMERPQNSRPVGTTSDGNHSHTLTTNNQGAHSHTATTGSYGNHAHTLTTQNTGAHTHTLTTDSQGNHSHTLTTDNQGSHTHTLTTSSVGNSTGHTHSIEPTYIGIYAFKRTA